MAEPGAQTEFLDGAERYRGELLAHCYRMTGSVHDAEDLVQETLLRAWRSRDHFEHRASLRTWLYRIATNACLNALDRSPARRVLPAGLGAATTDPNADLRRAPEIRWLEPLPDRLLTSPDDPGDLVVARETVRLAFVTALQRLSPRQRAILLLRDVVGWSAADVAALLSTTTAAVNGALLRARRALATEPRDITSPDPVLLDRYVDAFARADFALLAELLRADAVVQMPPHRTWFRGRATITAFFALQVHSASVIRLARTNANAYPAIATYLAGPDGYRANSIHHITVREHRIATITAFVHPELFALFGLPDLLD